ncbi:MAG: PepSY domain-containing protein [Rhodobacteraceae bacterium]|jgi:hypothetical protein|nr:PepSY domain-containing protein [Paracoccaceae bacterium]
MIRTFARPLMIALALTASAPAFASDEVVSDADKATITAMLTGMGYEVRKVEFDDGKLEAYAVKDGKNYEVVLRKTDDAFEIVEIEG